MAPLSQSLHKLDEVLALVDHCSPAEEAELAHEHVQQARAYLLGAMPEEFSLNVELAKRTLARMEHTPDCGNAQKILAGLSRN